MDVMKKLSSLQEISKAQLSKIFSVNPNRKFLIIQPSLIKPLEKVCGVKWLKSSGVEKIFKLEPVAPSFEDNTIFFIITPEMSTFKQVVDQIRAEVDIEQPVKNKFHIIVVPKHLHAFEEHLEQLGLIDSSVKLHSFQWMPILLDSGILSLELPILFNDLFVYENLSFLPVMSKSFWQLSFVTGKPKVVLALGQHSNSLLKQYDQLCEDRGDTDKLECDFGAVVILDRNVDYVSTLLTSGVYSSLLSEVYNISAGVCDNTKHSVESDERLEIILDEKCNPIIKKQPVNITLNSSQDSVYADIKNRFFTEVTSVLSSLTKQLRSEKLSSKEMQLDEIKQYVQTKLQATKSRKKFITNHLLAAETIINTMGHRYEKLKEIEVNIMKNSNKSQNFSYLEEILPTENDKFLALRLFCLMCITQKLSETEVRSFWRKFLHQFGFSYGFAFNNLISTGFVEDFTQNSTSLSIPGKINLKIPKFATSNFYNNAKNLKQIPSDPAKVNLKHPTCASYVFGGAYIPLITQIANFLFNSLPLDEIRNKLEPLGHPLSIRNEKGYPLMCRTILIYIVGGITYAEISACNLLETLLGGRIVVLSDRVVNGNQIMADILNLPK